VGLSHHEAEVRRSGVNQQSLVGVAAAAQPQSTHASSFVQVRVGALDQLASLHSRDAGVLVRLRLPHLPALQYVCDLLMTPRLREAAIITVSLISDGFADE